MALDRALRSIRFTPRPSLKAELLLRVRRLDFEHRDHRLPVVTWVGVAILPVLVGGLIYLFWALLLRWA